MPKKTGYLYEQVISLENCKAAEMDMTCKKTKNNAAKRIRANAEKESIELSELISSGKWEPMPYREWVLYDPHRKKNRTIKVPCLRDQAVHHAVMRITAPYILRRNYFYNCGSIPGAGQIRATKAVQGWLGSKKSYKYGETLDIQKFYDNVRHKDVMKALRKIFKDKKFLALHEKILSSMSENGIGLAIGFYPSAWYANLVLADVDRAITQSGYKVKVARYMDDIAILGNSKRELHRLRGLIIEKLWVMGLCLKRNWQVFKIKGRGLRFLSYRFFKGYTIMTKQLMYRITRKIKRISGKAPTLHQAATVVSYMGIVKHCDSYNYRKRYIYPFVSIKQCKEVISYETKNKLCRMPVGV